MSSKSKNERIFVTSCVIVMIIIVYYGYMTCCTYSRIPKVTEVLKANNENNQIFNSLEGLIAIHKLWVDKFSTIVLGIITSVVTMKGGEAIIKMRMEQSTCSGNQTQP